MEKLFFFLLRFGPLGKAASPAGLLLPSSSARASRSAAPRSRTLPLTSKTHPVSGAHVTGSSPTPSRTRVQAAPAAAPRRFPHHTRTEDGRPIYWMDRSPPPPFPTLAAVALEVPSPRSSRDRPPPLISTSAIIPSLWAPLRCLHGAEEAARATRVLFLPLCSPLSPAGVASP
jgi:hypothetical protein